jgi:hypothetical protein
METLLAVRGVVDGIPRRFKALDNEGSYFDVIFNKKEPHGVFPELEWRNTTDA